MQGSADAARNHARAENNDHSASRNRGQVAERDKAAHPKEPAGQQENQSWDGRRSGWVVTVAAAGAAAVTLMSVSGVAVWAGFSLLASRTNGHLAPALFVVSVFFLVAGVMIPLGIFREWNLENEESVNCKKECKEFQEALEKLGHEAIAGLALANFKQMRAFTVIAMRQARMAFYASLIGAAVSLFVLVSGATVAVSLPGTSTKVEAGLLAAAGSALSSFLARTFLRTYEMTSRQMSYYYGQPLVHCYLLHAEWLTLTFGNTLGEDVEAKLLERIVEASIQSAASAQDHLLSLRELDRGKRDGGPSAVRPPSPAVGA
jgi:hypothetical protein